MRNRLIHSIELGDRKTVAIGGVGRFFYSFRVNAPLVYVRANETSVKIVGSLHVLLQLYTFERGS
jgi:hypothetical protein